ncbi:MAG: hypothetical protein AzoDbin1_03897 [Azoarcus sp.]|nr:hypothetical protein [Azoarcus sp.]
MAPRFSKPVPGSLRAAFEMDRDHAKRHRRSMEHVAELMDETPGNLYKMTENGTMYVSRLLGWAHHTGSDAVVRYLAARLGKVVIDVPPGRATESADVHALQAALNASVGALLGFMSGELDRDACMATLGAGLESLAWHRENVRKSDQPELEF